MFRREKERQVRWNEEKEGEKGGRKMSHRLQHPPSTHTHTQTCAPLLQYTL